MSKTNKQKQKKGNDVVIYVLLGVTMIVAIIALILGIVAVASENNETSNCNTVCNFSTGLNSTYGNGTSNITNFTSNLQLEYADFFALMPGDNTATVGLGAGVSFPQPGPSNGGTIFAINPTSFRISNGGHYDISFFVSVNNPGQLQLKLNGAPFAQCVSGRATGTTIISARCLVNIPSPNATISVINPPGNTGALTITPIAGGATAVSAHLIIIRLR